METLNIKLAGLTCEACIKVATKRIKNVAGVEEVSIDLATGQTKISSCHPVTLEEVEASLAETHYSVVK